VGGVGARVVIKTRANLLLFSLSHTLVHDEEVGRPAQVDVADAGQQEAGDGVLERRRGGRQRGR
jgi:hypothetical protein